MKLYTIRKKNIYANSLTPVYLYYDEDGVHEQDRWKSELNISLCYLDYNNTLKVLCDIPIYGYNSISIPTLMKVDFNLGKFVVS